MVSRWGWRSSNQRKVEETRNPSPQGQGRPSPDAVISHYLLSLVLLSSIKQKQVDESREESERLRDHCTPLPLINLLISPFLSLNFALLFLAWYIIFRAYHSNNCILFFPWKLKIWLFSELLGAKYWSWRGERWRFPSSNIARKSAQTWQQSNDQFEAALSVCEVHALSRWLSKRVPRFIHSMPAPSIWVHFYPISFNSPSI